MSELRILFGQAAGHGDLTVRVVPTSGNASEAIPFQPFLTDADYEDLRWYLEEFMDLPMGGAEVRAHIGTRDVVRQVGGCLDDVPGAWARIIEATLHLAPYVFWRPKRQNRGAHIADQEMIAPDSARNLGEVHVGVDDEAVETKRYQIVEQRGVVAI